MIEFSVIIFIFVLTGFMLGVYSQSPDKITSQLRRIKRKINKDRIGAVQNLSPRDQNLKGSILEEEEKEMERVLDDVL